MDRSTITGIAAGIILILLAIAFEGGIAAFFSFSSLVIVLGGVTAATLVNYNIDDIVNAQHAVQVAFRSEQIEMLPHIEMFTIFSRRARRNGLLILDDDVRYIEDPYLRNGLELAIDGISEENLKNILHEEIESLKKRHDQSIRMLQSMATYAPAFGMIGTLIGLILMLGNLDESGDIGAGLSIALITTLYGTIFANLIFAPLSGKLEELSVKEINEKEMLKTAIISLSNGENPRILEKKMLTYVTPENRKEYARMYGDRGYSKQQEEKLYSHWLNQQKDKWENTLTDLQAG
jgi:chemotaxis protein MotA